MPCLFPRVHGRSRALRPVGVLCAILFFVSVLALVDEDSSYAAWPPWATDEPPLEPTYPEATASVAWLAGNLDRPGTVVVDARRSSSYAAGHIPSAVSIPPDSLGLPSNARALRSLISTFERFGLTGDQLVVCYGDGPCSPEAARVMWALELCGADRVQVLEDGIDGWSAVHGPLETEHHLPRPIGWTAVPDTTLVASREYVERMYGTPGFEIIDARSRSEWEGEAGDGAAGTDARGARGADADATGAGGAGTDAPGAAARTGHIPHSLPFDFRSLLNERGELRAPAETRAILARLGPRPSSPVDLQSEFVVHGDGVAGQGVLGYFLLRRAGIERVRYYPGGWTEWSGEQELPVVRIIHGEELVARVDSERRWWFFRDRPATSFVLLDVRHHRDYEIGHIPGAVNLTSRLFADSLGSVLSEHWPDIDRTTIPIVTYCYGPDCIRSRDTATAAARMGFLRVERFLGGIEEWEDVGGRLIRR